MGGIFQKKTSELYEEIIIEYAGLVKLVAGRLSMYLDIMLNMMTWLATGHLD